MPAVVSQRRRRRPKAEETELELAGMAKLELKPGSKLDKVSKVSRDLEVVLATLEVEPTTY